ncbi:hypothetical protein G6011_06048 [Alternaria panax]|uniref:Uncharacterized protein n=1 Tax=Alternaria panax TaxID=48097 RepID=A0AAD4I542_9PLEO|nr:hypothetical protein G6011_06048 [Alternaria panax]
MLVASSLACRRATNGGQKKKEETAQPEPPLRTKKRLREPLSTEDNGERRVRARRDPALQDQAAPKDEPKLSPKYAREEAQGIVKIMRDFAAATGQIVAFIKGASSAIEDPSRQTVIELLRGILSKLIPCVTRINDAKALGIEIVGLADLVDPSLQREGVFTIISSSYASSVPKPLECRYDEYFAVGDIFWDRITELAADPHLVPGEKVAPSSQGLVCVAYRLHLVTKVTSRNMWTTPGRLRGGKGILKLDQRDHWMHAHLHNPDNGRLVDGRTTGNGTPHHSLDLEPETHCRGQAIN